MSEISKINTAIFAGGCFWCLQADFEHLSGVISTEAGYDGGHEQNPNYHRVCSGQSGYYEVVKVEFDPNIISYLKLVYFFWRHIDPTNSHGQFCDLGQQYQTAILYQNSEQQQQALASLAVIKKVFINVATQIIASTHFYPAEVEHQHFADKQPAHYQRYRQANGRQPKLAELWQQQWLPENDSTAQQQSLSSLQLQVTQNKGTEQPFSHPYNHLYHPGLYVDIVSGQPLFCSQDKFDSGSGWPSFCRPLTKHCIIEHHDRSLDMVRVEVCAQLSGSHLGHVFEDGPAPTGLRYCINGASLRFIAVEDLQAQGYADYLSLFKAKDAHSNA